MDIVIVNWNTGNSLRECVRSLCVGNQDTSIISRLIIVDNASDDDSLVDLGDLPFPVSLVKNTINRGFAAACNQGAQLGSADYILFLNPDTIVNNKALARPIAFMDEPQHAHMGICGIRLTDGAGNPTVSCAHFPSIRLLFGEISGLNHVVPTVFPPLLMTIHELESSRIVDQVIGAFFLVRRSVYEAVHGFDERFFVYYEEVDLSLRVKRLGYFSYYLADTTAVHLGGVSSCQVKPRRLFYSIRSRTLYWHKHFSQPSLWCLVVITLTVEPIARLVWSLVKGSPKSAYNTLTAYWMLLVEFLRRKSRVKYQYER